MATLQEIADHVRESLAAGGGLDRTLKFDLGGEGVMVIDGGAVSTEDGPSDLTISTTTADLEAMRAGRLDPMRAVMSGRMRFSDMGLAMKLQPQLQALFRKMR